MLHESCKRLSGEYEEWQLHVTYPDGKPADANVIARLYDAKKYYTLVATGENDLAGYYTYSATNVRLQELTLSYKFNSKLFNNVIKDLTLSFVATNPWMIYCKAPFDPELTASTGTYGQGNDYFMQPSLKSYGFSVKFKF